MGKSKPEVIFPVPVPNAEMPDGYIIFIKQIKESITQQRIKTVLALILL